MAKKQKHTKKKNPSTWIALSLFAAGLMALAGLYMEQNTRISGVEFSGAYFTDEESLSEAIHSPVGLMADSVNYSEIFHALRALPYVESVNLSMGYKGKLTFEIEEKMPLALLSDGAKRVYVAEGGVKLPIVPGKVPDVPILYGFSAESLADTLKSDEYEQVENLLKEAQKNEFGWATISEIAWSDREGVVTLSHENGVKLIFGKHDFSEKLLHWQEFYGKVISKEGIQSFQSVDLRFRNQIVTRKS